MKQNFFQKIISNINSLLFSPFQVYGNSKRKNISLAQGEIFVKKSQFLIYRLSTTSLEKNPCSRNQEIQTL